MKFWHRKSLAVGKYISIIYIVRGQRTCFVGSRNLLRETYLRETYSCETRQKQTRQMRNAKLTYAKLTTETYCTYGSATKLLRVSRATNLPGPPKNDLARRHYSTIVPIIGLYILPPIIIGSDPVHALPYKFRLQTAVNINNTVYI